MPSELRRFYKALWVAPLVFALIVTTLYPTIFLIALATTKSTLGKPFRSFVGLKNITGSLTDAAFQLTVVKGVAFAFASAIVEIVVGFALACLFVALMKAGRYLLIVVLLPLMTPPVMVGVAWKLILAPSGGLLNGVLMNMGITDAPISFLGDARAGLALDRHRRPLAMGALRHDPLLRRAGQPAGGRARGLADRRRRPVAETAPHHIAARRRAARLDLPS